MKPGNKRSDHPDNQKIKLQTKTGQETKKGSFMLIREQSGERALQYKYKTVNTIALNYRE